jgi:MerR family transcriptional regulator, thiopeptide resistance regulator
MKRLRTYQVKEMARLTGVTVRTLHYYHEIGLLIPKEHTRSGYRLYSEQDLFRLQQILIGRELGMSLEAIRHSLDDPDFDYRQALLTQRKHLEERVLHTEKMIRAIDHALAALDDQAEGEMDTMKSMFDGFEPSDYKEEAEQRWGNTSAYQESAKRTKSYGAKEWAELKAEQDSIYGAMYNAMQAGNTPTEIPVMEIAERHRASINRWFYTCDHEMHLNLASMYENDQRFADNIDKYGDGLTTYLVAAIRANAAYRKKV